MKTYRLYCKSESLTQKHTSFTEKHEQHRSKNTILSHTDLTSTHDYCIKVIVCIQQFSNSSGSQSLISEIKQSMKFQLSSNFTVNRVHLNLQSFTPEETFTQYKKQILSAVIILLLRSKVANN